jgi:hypothetical protein
VLLGRASSDESIEGRYVALSVGRVISLQIKLMTLFMKNEDPWLSSAKPTCLSYGTEVDMEMWQLTMYLEYRM